MPGCLKTAIFSRNLVTRSVILQQLKIKQSANALPPHCLSYWSQSDRYLPSAQIHLSWFLVPRYQNPERISNQPCKFLAGKRSYVNLHFSPPFSQWKQELACLRCSMPLVQHDLREATGFMPTNFTLHQRREVCVSYGPTPAISQLVRIMIIGGSESLASIRL